MPEDQIFIGIDPGKTGALVTIDVNEQIMYEKCFDCQDTIENNARLLRKILSDIDPDTRALAALEKVNAMPKQGVRSVWNFAENFAMWKTLLTAFQVPYELVTPQTWMKGLVKPSDHQVKKKRGLTVCRRKYPGNGFFKLEKHDGRADATLMAIHLKRKICGNI
jgi:crossover junction endodeoxyribonuclease RuvC